MKKTVFLILCILAVSAAAKKDAYADMNLEAESALSGISVAFNNYYARNMFPEQSLAQSVELVGEGTVKINSESAPAVVELVEREKDRRVELISPEAYENVAISKVEDFVEIKTGTGEASDIVGRIYNHSAASIIDMIEDSGKQWYLIESGNVSGYVEAEYFVTGENAKDIAKDIAIIYGTVENTENLRLRSEPSREAQTLTLLSEDSTYVVLGEEGDFLKIQVDDDLVGYAFKDYIRTEISFDRAISLADEEERALEQESRKQEAEEAISRLEEAKRAEKEGKESAQQSKAAKETSTEQKSESKASAEESTVRKKESASAETKGGQTRQSAAQSSSEKQTQAVAAKPQKASSGEESTSLQVAKETQKPTSAEETIESLARGEVSAADQAPPGEGPKREGETTQSSAAENSVEELQTRSEKSKKESRKESTKESTTQKKESATQKSKAQSSPEISNATRDAIVAYAKQFVGNPYVYGGTSLTEGADCSGFTMQVYANFGYSLGRSSRDQAGRGRTISEEEIRPGDLVFYASGSYINHVAIYIGQGKVVHASNERTGIIISSMKYRTPVKIISFLD